MKAQDKIFMPNELLSEEWGRHIEGQDTEYIRKGAILELLRAKHAELDPPQNERDFGRIEAVEELIDKINSL